MYELRVFVSHLYGVKFSEWGTIKHFKTREEAMKEYHKSLEMYDDDFMWEVIYRKGDLTTIQIAPLDDEL